MVKHIYRLTFNLKVAGSNPALATILICTFLFLAQEPLVFCAELQQGRKLNLQLDF